MRRVSAIDRAKCAAKSRLAQLGWEVRRVREPSIEDTLFYAMPESCQIPGLGSLYETFFGQRTSGFFVEVGAFDGYSASNTFGLAERGWSGILVEPVPEYARRCRELYQDREDILVMNIAIGSTAGELRLEVAGMLTTANAGLAEDQAATESGRRTFRRSYIITVQMKTLDEVLYDKGVAPGLDLLVVDVEGFETEVFAGFDVNKWKPRMLIVELSETHPGLPAIRQQSAQLYSGLLAQGYVPVYKDAVNTVFVERDLWQESFA